MGHSVGPLLLILSITASDGIGGPPDLGRFRQHAEDAGGDSPSERSSRQASRAPALADCAALTVPVLEALVGSWRVEVEFRSGEEWVRADARSSIQPDLGRCVLVERFAGTRGGRPFEILGIMGANGNEAPIQRMWVHSQHGILTLYAGHARDGELLLDTTVPVQAGVVRLRLAYLDITPDGFRFESRRSTDGGATWLTTWRATYRREK